MARSTRSASSRAGIMFKLPDTDKLLHINGKRAYIERDTGVRAHHSNDTIKIRFHVKLTLKERCQ